MSANVSEPMDPAWYMANSKTAAEVIGEMAAIPAQQVIIRARVLLYQLRDYSRDVFCGEGSVALENSLPEVMIRMASRHHAGHTRLGVTLRATKAPLEVIHLNAHMKGATKLDWRIFPCKDLIYLNDGILV